jgi:hypothetical protein
MSWALEVCDRPESPRVGVLSGLIPWPLVELGWLEDSQVQQLATLYELEEQDLIQNLLGWFSGQPFLTHTAVSRYRDLSPDQNAQNENLAWEQLRTEIEKGEAEFGRHLSRLRARLRPHLGPSESVATRLAENPSVLRQFGIVKPTRSDTAEEEGTVARFYLNHLARL